MTSRSRRSRRSWAARRRAWASCACRRRATGAQRVRLLLQRVPLPLGPGQLAPQDVHLAVAGRLHRHAAAPGDLPRRRGGALGGGVAVQAGAGQPEPPVLPPQLLPLGDRGRHVALVLGEHLGQRAPALHVPQPPRQRRRPGLGLLPAQVPRQAKLLQVQRQRRRPGLELRGPRLLRAQGLVQRPDVRLPQAEQARALGPGPRDRKSVV